MSATTTPPRAAAKPPAPHAHGTVKFSRPTKKGLRIGLYGPGGVGKTSLASTTPGRTVFFDLDGSLSTLGLDLETVPVLNWGDLEQALLSPGWDGVDNIVIDSVTMLEDWLREHIIRTVPHPDRKDIIIKRIEDYGYGKGYQHMFEKFVQLLGWLEIHMNAGRNIILIMHECTKSVPNPMGEDFLRYEPRLQDPASGKATIRLRVKEWLDHLLFIGYDMVVDEDGKATGAGTRTIYTAEMPFCMAKNRGLSPAIEYVEGDTTLWNEILGKEN